MKTKTKPTSKKSANKKPKPKQLAPLWKHGNTSLIVIVIVIVAIAAGGIGWMVARKTQVSVRQEVSAPSGRVSMQVPQFANESEGIIYTDRVHGYQVKLPNDWSGYQVVDGKFFLPTTDNEWTEDGVSSGYASVFAISSINSSEWGDLASECAKGNYEPACAALEPSSLPDSNPLLGKNEKIHFLVSWAQAGPNDSNWQRLAAEISGVDALRKRFSLLK